MTTRTGDATAELLDLLRDRCPDVAEETLRQLASAVVSVEDALGDPAGGDGATGADDGEQPLRWSRLTMGSIPGLDEFATTVSAPVEVIAALLEFVAGILDVVSALLIAIPDPYRALILAAYEILKAIVDDLLNSGAYVYADMPGLTSNVVTLRDLGAEIPAPPTWLAGDEPKPAPRPVDGFQQWAHTFEQSFDDPGDLDRPVFSDGAPVEALFIVATAPQLPDLAAVLPLLAKLFDLAGFEKAWDDFAATFPELPDDEDRARIRGSSVAPDWKGWRLRDIAPPEYPLRQLEKVPELLKTLLLNVDNVIDLIRDLVDAIRTKIDLLRELIEILQQIIDALQALTATGMHALLVVTDEGVQGLVKAFLEAENRPNTDENGEVMTAHAIAGVCLLTGTSEVVPANALPIWELFGQGESLAQAYEGLVDDWHDLSDQAEDAAADTAALATDAWHGAGEGDRPTDKGVEGLWGEFGDAYEEQRDATLAALGLSEKEADQAARSDRAGLVAGLEESLAEGLALHPSVLAHIEATRRARARASGAMAFTHGARRPQERP